MITRFEITRYCCFERRDIVGGEIRALVKACGFRAWLPMEVKV